MARPVKTIGEIRRNLAALESYRMSVDRKDRGYYADLLRRGACFVTYTTESQRFFGPSRFIGYADNNRHFHDDNPTKDGKVTNYAIERAIHTLFRPRQSLERLYLDHCRSEGIVPSQKERRYIDIGEQPIPRPRNTKARSAIKRALLKIAVRLKRELESDPRCEELRPAPKSDSKPRSADTDGYWLGIAKLGSSVYIELWLDRFSGHQSPRLWYGFTSYSKAAIERVLKLPIFVRTNRIVARKTHNDITGKTPYRFVHPLESGQFGAPIYEFYGRRDPYFLGQYSPHRWPLTDRDCRSIASEASNFIATVVESLRYGGDSAPGWGRQDPETEAAAVELAKLKLRKHGYTVESYENRRTCGYDLHATRSDRELHVEVKGCKGSKPYFFISRNEYKASLRDPYWFLWVVTNAKDEAAARIHSFTGEAMRARFILDPTQWSASEAG